MTSERWEQIKSVLGRTLDLKPEQRAAFLDQACHGDQSPRHEVESLLAAGEDERSSFLQSPPQMQLPKGTRLGDYEIQSLLGSGGMGEVYRARDVRLRRDVAIKVLPTFLSANSDRLPRFEQEAMAAAALSHPNVLAVYQMGTYFRWLDRSNRIGLGAGWEGSLVYRKSHIELQRTLRRFFAWARTPPAQGAR